MTERLSSLFAGVVLVSAAAALFVPDALSGGSGEIPDSALTPGLVAGASAAEICTPHGLTYSRAHRQTTREMKLAVVREYGHRPHDGDSEIDHLVPLCLGGADDIKNLWWQPGNGHGTAWTYHLKDRLEAEACREVCAGQVDLATAQSWFINDWRIAYRQHFGEPR